MKIVVAGAGSWGTALARLLACGPHQVVLWARSAALVSEMARNHSNPRYLPGIPLPPALQFETTLSDAVADADCVVIASPSKGFRETAAALSAFDGIAISVTKGIEFHSGLTMCGILDEAAPRCRSVALSGPSLADEVARDIPSAVVAASKDPAAARLAQEIFHRPTFRVYTSQDRVGVELGGALKNVIAIGAGMCDGIGLGDNSKAALVTRAIAEIRRLGVADGALPETFSGLSGLGDLTLTCFSRRSRNRSLGERLGRGENLQEILKSSVSVAEGCPTAQSAWALARKLKVETPIIDEVYALLWEGKSVAEAVRDLTCRTSKAED